MSSIYKQDGVDVSLGDRFSQYAWKVCRESYNNCPFMTVEDLSRGNFRGPRGITFRGLPEGWLLTAEADGVGTKPVVITAARSHHLASRDLLAMCNGDVTRNGGLPLFINDNLDDRALGESEESETYLSLCRLLTGFGEAAKEQKVVISTGESAELGVCVGSEDPGATTMFNWAGVTIGAYHRDKMILGDSLAAGQVIIGLREYGFRSNGLSSARKALKLKYGDEWYNNPEAKEDVRRVAEPSKLYDLFLSQMNGWWGDDCIERPIKAHLIVHVTGGAIKSKLGEDKLFPLGLTAILDDLWEPPEIMKKCAEWRGMSDKDCYETWGCGTGAFVVIDECDTESYISQAARSGIEARRCGEVMESIAMRPPITLRSKFSSGKIVTL